eukprot:TRINITY_DN3566_c0_g1_i2.p1 TRINITY_DN3566_c0_g1~~TRINITY_DN3566_c0_g1_i2.p1  ORF type:complete len:348 (+),score=50.37 TRINITY_DN3566_c0_g1_i2:331-1374(+)
MSALSMFPSAAILGLLKNSSAMTQRLTILFYITLPVLILQYVIEYAIYFRAVAGYHALTTRRLGCCCRVLSLCMSCCKACFLWVSIYFAVLFMACAGSIAEEGHIVLVQKALTPLAISRVEFWFVWFATDLFLPCIGFVAWWRKEKRQEEIRLETLEELQRLQALKDDASAASGEAEATTSHLRVLRERLGAISEGRLQSLLDSLERCWAPIRRRCPCLGNCFWSRARADAGADESSVDATLTATPGCCESAVTRVGAMIARLADQFRCCRRSDEGDVSEGCCTRLRQRLGACLSWIRARICCCCPGGLCSWCCCCCFCCWPSPAAGAEGATGAPPLEGYSKLAAAP